MADRSRGVRLSIWFITRRPCGLTGPTTPACMHAWFGLFRVRSPLLAESLTCFLFLRVLRWFTSLRCLPPPYVFSRGYSGITQSGFPHSEIPGSKPACGSPRLIAACRVLHRLLAPRHSPYALSSLTKCSLPLTACVWSKNYRLQSIQLSKDVPELLAACGREQTLVENTGIEPVTSWLQTRRSPS